MTDLTKPKERWGTRIGVILAVAGSAVGLGNFLRFPGLASQYEGGAFMVPYFIALFVLGLPLAWGEWAMGRFGGRHGYNSSPGIYRSIWRTKASPYLGVLGMLVPVVIYMYYVLIESWCLAFAWFYLNGTMAEVAEAGRAAATDGGIASQPFQDHLFGFIGAGANGAAFTGLGLLFLAICFVLNFSLIYRGLSKGIEKFCFFAMPALILCAMIILVRVLTLPEYEGRGVLHGLGYMWNPRGGEEGGSFLAGFLASLLNPKMWLDATGQIFFSLSVGFGIIITYSSYLRKDDDVALSALSSASGNEFCEVALGGMITIPAAFIFLGLAVSDSVGSAFALGFLTLPMVFAEMPAGGVVGFLFFFLLFLAAVTSSLSMLQPAIALIEEALGIGRKASVSILGFITLCGAMFVLYFSADTLALDTFDTWVGTLCIYLLAMFQTLLFGWALGPKRGMAELDRGASLRVPRVVGFLLRYVAPVYLTVIFVAFVIGEINKGGDSFFARVITEPVVAMSVGFLATVVLFFLLIISQGVKRWRIAEAKFACSTCGYDLRGLDRETCPECGSDIPADKRNLPPTAGRHDAEGGQTA